MIPISIVIPYIRINSEVRLWVQKRESLDELSGLLEFPGGKIEPDESPQDAGVREVLEETHVKLESQKLQKFKNYHPSKDIILMIFLFEDKDLSFDKNGYVPLEELQESPEKIPPNNIEILVDLEKYFG